ncbi:MAG: hypothetical protein NTY22_09040 [Proteobacteria bacterium]|nr:hypothetical protein [Pseudomonadota bacterium]
MEKSLMEKPTMEKQTFKKVNFNEPMEKYLIFDLTPEKKLLDIVAELKDVFPRQKEWRNLNDNRPQKEIELLEKFRRRGKLYRKICQNWMNKNMHLAEEFNNYFQSSDKEISTEEVLKFFESIKKKFNMSIKDIMVFVHIYLEHGIGMSLFEESALKLDAELEKHLKSQ